VGEICRKVGDNNLRFEGYFGNEGATSQKFRHGCYHSGDLGHIRIVNGNRYMFFNGRTDDWIRKDGENSRLRMSLFTPRHPAVIALLPTARPVKLPMRRL